MNAATLDRQVLLALCARDIASSTNALTAAETWRLLDTLAERDLRPRDLLEKPDGIDDDRLSGRLSALDQVVALIEHLAERNIWVATPIDPEYPVRLGERLGKPLPRFSTAPGRPTCSRMTASA
jgi:predicted Rossmann fold nucleotide-binding protein DprA/Smf involved in DNA uptake